MRNVHYAVLLWFVSLCAFPASVGGSADAFRLDDVGGKPVQLADFKGRYVVLEWNNPGCPFVQKHYNSGNMQALQRRWAARGVAWLTINSNSRASADYLTPSQWEQWLQAKAAAPRAALPDADGIVARLYSAKTTPHMFVIDPAGTLLYAGAIDDKRSTDLADVPTALNYVSAALDEAMAGKPVSVASTEPYGCSVKY